MDVQLIGIVIGCPYEDPCITCPMNETRKIDGLENQFEKIKNLKNTEKIELILRHKKCSYNRRFQNSSRKNENL